MRLSIEHAVPYRHGPAILPAKQQECQANPEVSLYGRSWIPAGSNGTNVPVAILRDARSTSRNDVATNVRPSDVLRRAERLADLRDRHYEPGLRVRRRHRLGCQWRLACAPEQGRLMQGNTTVAQPAFSGNGVRVLRGQHLHLSSDFAEAPVSVAGASGRFEPHAGFREAARAYCQPGFCLCSCSG